MSDPELGTCKVTGEYLVRMPALVEKSGKNHFILILPGLSGARIKFGEQFTIELPIKASVT